MDNFIVSARKYRPITFDTVVGQASITNTLKNAIKNNQLAQAFLFCGPRGVGKTTCARILAKTINCMNITENMEACDKCESCTSFNNSASFNIYELDAASNNSVDDIRNLVDQVRIPPQVGKYKVYIIDEVHMLSAAAFNAFLKTLEEPPAYAKFILATTEKHKIIPTILSRCQIFDFKRILIEDISKHLLFVAGKENIVADCDALNIIAQKADGALRDALSIFDQLVSFAGNHLTYDAVIENLNVLDYDYYFKITDFFLANDIPSSLVLFSEIIDKGFDGQHFLIGLGEHFRNLLVCKDAITVSLLEVGDNIKLKYKEQSQTCSAQFLLKALELNNQTDINYKSSNNKRLSIEIMLMQISSIITATNTSTEQSFAKKPEIIQPTVQPKAIPVVPPTPSVKPITQETVVKPKVAPLPGMTGSFSVKDSLSDIKKETTETESNTIEPEEVIESTQEMVDKIWNEYTASISESSKLLYVTLSKNKPILKENNIIELTIDNKVQEEEIRTRKPEILEYLRKGIKNFNIQLETIIAQTNEKGKILYTDTDKFDKMAEKNPDLQKMKDELNLEIEF
jgi:DNA polymerase-3 subunit gamma/tau